MSIVMALRNFLLSFVFAVSVAGFEENPGEGLVRELGESRLRELFGSFSVAGSTERDPITIAARLYAIAASVKIKLRSCLPLSAVLRREENLIPLEFDERLALLPGSQFHRWQMMVYEEDESWASVKRGMLLHVLYSTIVELRQVLGSLQRIDDHDGLVGELLDNGDLLFNVVRHVLNAVARPLSYEHAPRSVVEWKQMFGNLNRVSNKLASYFWSLLENMERSEED